MPDITVGDQRAETHLDARTGTQNTKLAAALLVMGFQLAKQPFTTLPRMKGGAVQGTDTTIWFIPVIKYGEAILSKDDVEREWRYREDSDVANSGIPQVVWMRAALQARENTVRNIVNGPAMPPVPIGAEWFVTDNFKLAVCLIGAGYKLNIYKDRKYYFNPDARRAAGVWMREEGRETMQWMKKAVFQIEELVAAIRGPGNAPLIRVANASTGALLTMSSQAPGDLQRALLNELHKGQ